MVPAGPAAQGRGHRPTRRRAAAPRGDRVLGAFPHQCGPRSRQRAGERGRRGAPALVGLPAAPPGGRPRRRTAQRRRRRRVRHGGHRRVGDHPVDVRRPDHAPTGRAGQLRARRPLGRGGDGHQRPLPGPAHRPPQHGLLRRAPGDGPARLGLLLRAGPRSRRRCPGRPGPVHHLGPFASTGHVHGARSGLGHRGEPAHRPPLPPSRRRGSTGAAELPGRRAGRTRRRPARPAPAPAGDPRPARPRPGRLVPRAAARGPVRGPPRHRVHLQGGDLPPPTRPRRRYNHPPLRPHHARLL
jgi:hypothetical protein